MQTNPFKNQIIEFHILQSFPVSCLNRDDVGSPKSAIVGGVNRARVSSQCWKRAVRMSLQDLDIKLGIRTKKLPELIEAECKNQGATDQQAKDCAKKISDYLSKDTLLFLTEAHISKIAEFAKTHSFDLKITEDQSNEGKSAKKKGGKKKDSILEQIKSLIKTPDGLDGLDIALFGRMIATAAELQIEAASSFSHAISTHKVAAEIDFFTALDDKETEQGSAHLGVLEFNSATYYRYISLNLGQLYDNLNDTIKDTIKDTTYITKAVEAFTKALFLAIPAARQTTFSAASPWSFAKIFLRSGQRIQIPFDEHIKHNGEGYLKPSIKFMNDYLKKQKELWGSLFKGTKEYTYSIEGSYTIDNLVDDLKNAIAEVQSDE